MSERHQPSRPPEPQAGTASGVFNTSRQIGGALAVAVFGAMLADQDTFMAGLRTSLLIAAGVTLAAAGAGQLLRSPSNRRVTPAGTTTRPALSATAGAH